ncbi:MAG: class I SAM-dependent rRNA methyltransferase [Christensenellaceae bacterium]|nr:class I SAM-dependent rRNA methyltransferase [Christensenellaceae bacterium]MDD6927485.1 class I SAM-dependent rRNA methyltransferase [bacterium]
MYTLTLKKNEEKRILLGHPWVYANEVAKIEGKDAQGSIAKVCAFDGRFIGYGYINHLSKIIVRILTRRDEIIDKDFFKKRIVNANDLRVNLGFNDNYRVCFGENDLLPGLVVDKYGDYLCVQFLTLGMEVRKDMILDILEEIFSPKGIYERSDVSVREKEGLKQFKGVVRGAINSPVLINENGVKMFVDLENGQKTGYFLDQKENRLNLRRYVKDKTVLDCFSNVGGFALNAAIGGAKDVTALDISEIAVEYIRKNAELNGLKNIKTECADVFERLREYRREEKKFDVIILDPPAFTKSKETVKEGYKGYKDINIQALKLLRSGGILVTCSCSQHLTVNLFNDMLKESISQAGVNAKMLELRIQSRDHSTLIGLDEGLYLKVAVLYVWKN